MKRKMKLSALGSALAMAGVLAFSGQALADDVVTAKFTTMSDTAGITYTVTLPPAGGLGSDTVTTGTTAGIFNFDEMVYTYTPALPLGPIDTFDTDAFVSFCIDLADTIGNNSTHTWDVVRLGEAPDSTAGPMGVDKATDIGKALTYALEKSANNDDNVGGTIDINSAVLNDARYLTAAEKQAVQVVIWEMVHEDPATAGYDLDSGSATFSGLSNSALSFANSILGGYKDADKMLGLVGLTSTSTQDFIAQLSGQREFDTVVPIPAAAWLFGSALLGMVGVGYRRSRAA